MNPKQLQPSFNQHSGITTLSRTVTSRKTGFIHVFLLHKYRPLFFLVLAIFGLMLPFVPLPSGLSATPPSGTLTNVSGPVSYTAGPFLIANATAQANGTPICTVPQSCDDFTLTVAVTPPITTATHKVKVVVGWPVATADFDVYVLQGNTLVTTAASSSDPEVAFFAPINGVYTIRVTPFAPAGQSFTATISLDPIPAPPPPPPGIAPRYKNYPDTSGFGNEAGEPSIGVDWNPNVASLKHDQVNTGGVAFFTANANELRVSFDDCSSPATHLWEDKTSPQTSAGGLDPIGFVDHYGAAPTPGRVFQSQLAAAAGSILAFSDDDGETWTPSQGAGQPAGVDHQTVGGGPYNPNSTPPPPPHPTYPNAIYYASQDAATALIARSDTGGLTFGVGSPMWNLSQCGGLHGHIKVAPNGTVYVPNKGCGGQQGVAVSTDNGLTWVIRTVPGSTPADTDPSVGIGSDNTIYFGYQNGDGHPHMARSTDQGQTWVDRDVGGAFIQNCVFPEAVAGDGDRAAFGFLGTPTGGNYQDTANFNGIWHFYIATTYDRGLSYFLVDATPGDPVQIGSICTGGTTCGSDRNLLDFNDITVDKEGRVLAAYADGCLAPGCQENPPSPSSSSRSAKATIIRQSGGRRLFAAFDPIEPAAPAAPRLISATRDGSGVTVKWDEPDNSGSPLTGYRIYRGTSSGSETFLASIGPAAPRYLDTSANPNTVYFYRVTAGNAIGEGTFCREVQVTAAPPPATRCAEPYISITTDPAGDQTGNPANTQLDIREISIGEPFLNKCTTQLLFKMKVANLTVVPPQARWTIFFTRSNGTEYFVSMNSDDTGNPTGVVFNYGHTSIGPGGVRQLTADGLADDGSTFSVDGKILILISNSKLTFNLTPPPATLPPPAPGDSFGNVNAITQQTIGVLLATIDSSGSGSYALAGNLSCQSNNPPLAVMSAMPTVGDTPLLVNFNGSASSDPDTCDSVVSYTFDFGDGSAPVTQSSPIISHTYNAEGEYRASMRVTDSHGRSSDNAASANIEVEDVPTAVTLISFVATSYDGGVFIQWQTGFESNSLGFNLYREEGGKRKLITPQLIAGSALLTGPGVRLAGKSYVWRDGAAAESKLAQYWLEEIDLNGTSAWHGPVSAEGVNGAPAERSQASFLSKLGEVQPYVGSTHPVERVAMLASATPETSRLQSDVASGKAVKLSVKREGWYRVNQTELVAAGLDPNIDPRFLQLLVDGKQQPIEVTGEQDGRFEPSDAVEFYGVGLDTAATYTHVYWLVARSQPGNRIPTRESAGKPADLGSFSYSVERKDRTVYFSALRNGEKENFFGPVIASQPADQSLVLQHLDQSSPAMVEIAVQGVTTVAHQVRVTLNGLDLGTISFDGQAQGAASFSSPPGLLVEGSNQLFLVSQGGPSDVSLVDYVRVNYSHRYTADSDSLRFTAQGNQVVSVGGFSNSGIRVIDITDANAPQELIGAVEARGGVYSVSLSLTGTTQRTLFAFTNDRADHPVEIAANQPSSWRKPSNAADLVIITRREFFGSLDPLKSLRQNQKMTVAVADVEDIYDEFSFGQKTPFAVRDFLAFAKSKWKKTPRFLLLVGDSSYDPKNYLGLGDFDLVPTRLTETEFMETASDDWFADFDGDGLPELAVGRLPIRTAKEASLLVSKIIAYESSSPSRELMLIADATDGFDFEAYNNRLASLVPRMLRVTQVNRGRMDIETTKRILLDGIQRGQKLVNYFGHGSLNTWRGNLLTSQDALELTNEQLPVFVTMTCLNGYFDDPALDSLAESLLKAERGGAIAVWAPSGMALPSEQAAINQEFYRLIFSGDPFLTLGEAVRRAKIVAEDANIRRTWLLLGDPTIRLR